MSIKRSRGHAPLGVPDRNEQLLRAAVAMVAECQPCTPEQLQWRLRSEFGVSPGEAYRTTVRLIRSGYVRRSFFGELTLPGATARSGGGYSILTKTVIVLSLVAIFGFMAWGAIGMGTP